MAPLPAERHAEKIIEKIDDNRVTFIIGATGCGKSTQVPKMLRGHLRKRILCVQPRRMAVVAVATRVAEELDEPLGEKAVGYHIGAAKMAELDNTELMFVTAGIFLETLKCEGAASMARYGAVIIDEVHERSCENDLAFACLVQLALTAKELRNLKIVLMSATADVRRYTEFVRVLCAGTGGAPGLYAIGDNATVYSTTKRYLKDAIANAYPSEHSRPSPYAFEGHDRDAIGETCSLVARLTPVLVQRTIEEDGPGGTILIFLPTYGMIETMDRLLSDDERLRQVPRYVLHSSVDMEDCMAALLGEDGAQARVIIASAVAESSITIKKVTHVIDSCRACEIHWAPASGLASPHLVWVSQAQAKQRAGRTGRTNHGTVWQLITPSMYHDLPEFEMASMQLQLLRKEVLLLTCAGAKQLTDARKVLAACLDPPKAEVVNRAEASLIDNKFVERHTSVTRQRATIHTLEPTTLGHLVDALPLDVMSASLVLHGALSGLLEEAVVLAVLRNSQPMPLKREPNKQREYELLIAHYGPRHDELDTFVEDEMLANLAAYTSFQRWFSDPRRLRRVQRPSDSAQSELEGEDVLLDGLKKRPELNGKRVRVGKQDAASGRYAVMVLDEGGEALLVRRINLIEAEVEWCKERHISHTSLLATARTVEHVLCTLYHYFPPLMHQNLELRAQHDQHDHHPAAAPPSSEGKLPPGAIFGLLVDQRAERLLRKLLQTLRVAQDRHAATAEQPSDKEGPCFFFRRGCCSVDACPYSHQNSADTRPICRFALSGTCKFGAAKCRNRHPVVAASTVQHTDVKLLQSRVQLGLGSLIPAGLYTRAELTGALVDGKGTNCREPPNYLDFESVLLLGEGDFTFAASLAARAARSSPPNGGGSEVLPPHRIFATTLQAEAEVLASHPTHSTQALTQLRSVGANVHYNIDARTIDESALQDSYVECVVWNLPFAADNLTKSDPNQQLMRGFFASLIRCVQRWRHLPCVMPRLFITVGINQFADWGLLSVANDCFLTLEAVHKFDPTQHGAYASRRNERDDSFDVGEKRTYAFSVDEDRLVAAASVLHFETTSQVTLA